MGEAAIVIRQRLRPVLMAEAVWFTTRIVPAGPASVRIETTAVVPAALADLPRLGHELALDETFVDLTWYGLGPHETAVGTGWPVRCSAGGTPPSPSRQLRTCALRITATITSPGGPS